MKSFLAILCVGTALAAAPALAEPLRVGSTPTGVPFTFLDVPTNSIQGMMVDVVTAVGAEAGFEPTVQAVDFGSLVPALTANRIDMIAAAMLITPARQEVVDFSDPVFPYGEALVVAEDDDTAYSATLAELAGEVIGVQQGTIYLDELNALGGFGEVRVYDSLANIMRDLSLGRIKAGMGDGPIISYQIAQGTHSGVKIAEGYESQFGGSIGIAVRKGEEELLTRVNAALGTLKESGEIDRLAQKWNVD